MSFDSDTHFKNLIGGSGEPVGDDLEMGGSASSATAYVSPDVDLDEDENEEQEQLQEQEQEQPEIKTYTGDDIAKAAQAERAKGRRQMEQLNEQWQAKYQQDMLQMQQQLQQLQQQVGGNESDYDDDPVTALQRENEQLRKQFEELRNGQDQQAQMQQQLQQKQYLDNQLANYEQQFIKTTPDYEQALMHVRQIEYNKLDSYTDDILDNAIRNLGMHPPEDRMEKIVQVLKHQELVRAYQLAATGQDPAAAMYKTAQIYGYKAGGGGVPPAPGVHSKTSGKKPPSEINQGQSEGFTTGGAVPGAGAESGSSDNPFRSAWKEMQREAAKGFKY